VALAALGVDTVLAVAAVALLQTLLEIAAQVDLALTAQSL
jgi:hypothetical protein